MLITLSVRWASPSMSFAMKMTQIEHKSYWFFHFLITCMNWFGLVMLSFALPQHVPLVSRWEWGGALLRGGVSEGHPQRQALPFGYHGRARSADVTQLSWPAGFWAPEDTQGHVRNHTSRHIYKYEQWLLIHTVTLWMSSVFVPMFVFWVLSLTGCSVLFFLSS